MILKEQPRKKGLKDFKIRHCKIHLNYARPLKGNGFIAALVATDEHTGLVVSSIKSDELGIDRSNAFSLLVATIERQAGKIVSNHDICTAESSFLASIPEEMQESPTALVSSPKSTAQMPAGLRHQHLKRKSPLVELPQEGPPFTQNGINGTNPMTKPAYGIARDSQPSRFDDLHHQRPITALSRLPTESRAERDHIRKLFLSAPTSSLGVPGMLSRESLRQNDVAISQRHAAMQQQRNGFYLGQRQTSLTSHNLPGTHMELDGTLPKADWHDNTFENVSWQRQHPPAPERAQSYTNSSSQQRERNPSFNSVMASSSSTDRTTPDEVRAAKAQRYDFQHSNSRPPAFATMNTSRHLNMNPAASGYNGGPLPLARKAADGGGVPTARIHSMKSSRSVPALRGSYPPARYHAQAELRNPRPVYEMSGGLG
jgi:hypothetical protein